PEGPVELHPHTEVCDRREEGQPGTEELPLAQRVVAVHRVGVWDVFPRHGGVRDRYAEFSCCPGLAAVCRRVLLGCRDDAVAGVSEQGALGSSATAGAAALALSPVP